MRKAFTHRSTRHAAIWLALGLLVSTALRFGPPATAQSPQQPSTTSGRTTIYLPLMVNGLSHGSPDGLWVDADESRLAAVKAQRQIIPSAYRTLALAPAAAGTTLRSAPLEGTPNVAHVPARISLPLPDGRYQWFTLVESPIMAPGLAAKYPQIRTYAGQGIDDPAATLRLDWTPRGLHGLILSPNGTVYIDPYSTADTLNYISYYAKDTVPDPNDRALLANDLKRDPHLVTPRQQRVITPQVASGSQLRTYRLAVAAAGEYTQFQGGTVALALAAIVTSINRVDGIYEREVAVRLVLINNENQIIYTNAATDPYSNGDDRTANQTNIDSVIGNANYDIGHIFNTGGGGVATGGCVCTGSKAQGVTGSGSPVGDPFDVDYVAHEIGHQFGAKHTWNSTQGSCTTDQYSSGTAYEPGSGSTIMAYAGICGADDLQPNSDAYFHGVSIDEIVAFTTAGSGSTCGNTASSGNGIPNANAGADYTIPNRTPFVLTGSGSDPNGDALTYAWEEFDLAAAGPPNDPNRAPYFRSFTPTASPARTFPRLPNIINNTTSKGEVLPAGAATLNFRLTVRDNRLGGGGINDDAARVNVAGNAGPFRVTAPNTAVTWRVNDTNSVTWDVANTTAAPVSCPTVNILLSIDGGFTTPITLLAGVPNSGSANVVVPNNPTTQARIRLACATSIFFDISDTNFTIIPKADAGGPYTTNEGIDVTLNASGSSPSDTYAWDFDNDGLFDDANGVNPVYTLVGQDGLYPVAVQVTKNGVSASASATVKVNNVAPSVTLSADSPREEGAPLAARGTISDPGWLEPLVGTINWGDGLPSEPIAGTLENVRPDATLIFELSHVYADNATYTVQVCGTDNNAVTVCSAVQVVVTNVAPTIDSGQDQLIYEGDSAILDPATFNDKGTLDTHTATINWGDGSPAEIGVVTEAPFGPPGAPSGANGSVAGQHPYLAAPGVYTVTLTVTDDDGGVGVGTMRVTIVPGFFRFCAFADDASAGADKRTLIMKYASLDCATVPGGAPGKTRAGGVGSRVKLEAEDHALISGDLVSTNGQVLLKGDSTLTGNITAARDVELEDQATADGSVTTAGGILLKKRSIITGDATASASIQLTENSSVGGAIIENASVPPIHPITSVDLTLAAGAQNIIVAADRVLDPGAYGNLSVTSGAELTLRSGRYAFRQFNADNQTTLNFDLQAGPVIIDVVGDLVIGRETQMLITSAKGDAADILFRIGGGTINLGEEGIYLGTFLGLDAQAKLGQAAQLTGALYGRNVEVRELSRIIGRPAAYAYAASIK